MYHKFREYVKVLESMFVPHMCKPLFGYAERNRGRHGYQDKWKIN